MFTSAVVCLQNTNMALTSLPLKIQKCLARPDVCLDKPVKCKQKNHKAFSHPLYLHYYELWGAENFFGNRKLQKT